MDKPWKWDEAGKVKFALDGGEVREFTLIATDPAKVARFHRALALQSEVTAVLWEARQAFVEGRADYENAAQKLKGILAEWGVASSQQYDAAAEVSKFFMPDGVHLIFGPGVNLLTDFANEAVDRLVKAAAKAMTKAEDPKPETPPADDPPAPPSTEPESAVAATT